MSIGYLDLVNIDSMLGMTKWYIITYTDLISGGFSLFIWLIAILAGEGFKSIFLLVVIL